MTQPRHEHNELQAGRSPCFVIRNAAHNRCANSLLALVAAASPCVERPASHGNLHVRARQALLVSHLGYFRRQRTTAVAPLCSGFPLSSTEISNEGNKLRYLPATASTGSPPLSHVFSFCPVFRSVRWCVIVKRRFDISGGGTVAATRAKAGTHFHSFGVIILRLHRKI